MENKTIDQLIQLSKIFKQGFTVELKNSELNQYTNYKKPYIVSYQTIITIDYGIETKFNNCNLISDNCLIGGWLDYNNQIYYIELSKAFILKSMAIAYAMDNNQKAIYDIRTGECIKV